MDITFDVNCEVILDSEYELTVLCLDVVFAGYATEQRSSASSRKDAALDTTSNKVIFCSHIR